MDSKQRIAKLIKTYRNMRGLTQEELAKKLGSHQQRIYEYEGGQHLSTLDTLIKIAKALEIPPEKVLNMKPIGDETFERFSDALNKAPELYEFILYYSENKKKLKELDPVAVFEELSALPQNKRKKAIKALRKLKAFIED